MNTTVDEAIAQNNKIIAEFMGKDVLYGTHVQHETAEKLKVTIMKYHSDWNWLMEVVERIRKYHNGTEPLNNEQIGQLAQLIKKLNESLTLRNEVSKEAVYNACVEFIKWYNQQKSAENN